MAGSYPDYQAPRLSWDKYAKLFFVPSSGASSECPANYQADMNDETFGNTTFDGLRFGWGCMIFPFKVDIAGICLQMYGGGSDIETSEDTTNGFDGSWLARGAVAKNDWYDDTYARNSVAAVSWTGITAFRWYITAAQQQFGAIHLFGAPSAGQSLDRLELWHPTLDQVLGPAALDWGNAPRGSSETRQFRVKNLGAKTANSVTVSAEALSDATPSFRDQFTFSTGGAFAASQAVGDLAPGAVSGAISVKRTTPMDAALALWWARVAAVPASWT